MRAEQARLELSEQGLREPESERGQARHSRPELRSAQEWLELQGLRQEQVCRLQLEPRLEPVLQESQPVLGLRLRQARHLRPGRELRSEPEPVPHFQAQERALRRLGQAEAGCSSERLPVQSCFRKTA